MKPRSMPSKPLGGALILALLALLVTQAGRADAPAGRYTSAAGEVTDNQTGLIWQQADDGKGYSFAGAKTHCEGLGAGWRVPSVKELQTLVDETRSNPAIDSTVFTSTAAVGLGTCYQTSSQLAGTALGWLVCFAEGRSTYDNAANPYFVRCVR